MTGSLPAPTSSGRRVGLLVDEHPDRAAIIG